jgi:hypothetical protein
MTDKEPGGESIHVGDCHIWAEINYLDSPTDYREYLPQSAPPRSRVVGAEFIVLDNAGSFPWGVAKFLVVLRAMFGHADEVTQVARNSSTWK